MGTMNACKNVRAINQNCCGDVAVWSNSQRNKKYCSPALMYLLQSGINVSTLENLLLSF